MKIQIKKISVILLFILAASGLVSGSFENNYYSPRAKSMGSAFVAMADDYNTSLVNPAGLATLDKIGLSIAYAMPFVGFDSEYSLNDYFASVVYPAHKIGTFNFYFSSFSLSRIYSETTFSLDYGLCLNTYWKGLPFNLYAGTGVKLFRKGFILNERSESDPVFKDSRSKISAGIDLGFLLSPVKDESENNYRIGFSVLNLNQPDMGLSGKDPVYRKLSIGFAYSLVDRKFLRGSTVTPSLELDYSNDELLIPLGVEFMLFKKMLGLQAGWNSHEISAGLSFNYKFAGSYEVNFDYSFILANQLVENYGTHGIALTFKFLNLKI